MEPVLRAAVSELSWLLSRGYAIGAASTLVGDRHALRARQRLAVQRCACADAAVADRRARRRDPTALTGCELVIDGFNLLTTVEAALAGGVIIVGRDGCYRDMASMHGSWRRVAQTRVAIDLIAAQVAAIAPARSHWLLDRPVANSGRLAHLLRTVAGERALAWEVTCCDAVDARLRAHAGVVVSADAGVLDHPVAWTGLAARVVQSGVPDAWLLDLGADAVSPAAP